MTITWLISVIIAFILGFCIRSWFFKNTDQQGKLNDEIDKLNMEHTSYRSQVSNHLQKTSQLLEGYKHHQSKLESHLFAATQNFANASLFDSVDSVASLPESASDYLSTRGSSFHSNNSSNNSSDFITHDDNLDDNLDNNNNPSQSRPRDYAAS